MNKIIKQLLFLFLGSILISCGCPDQITAEKRIYKYTECYPSLKKEKIDTVEIIVPEIQYRDSIVYEEIVPDSLINNLISMVQIENDSITKESKQKFESELFKAFKKSVQNALQPIDTNGVLLNFVWKGNNLFRVLTVQEQTVSTKVTTNPIEITDPKKWWKYQETAVALIIIAGLLMFVIILTIILIKIK